MRPWLWYVVGAVVVTGAVAPSVLLLVRSQPAAVAPPAADNLPVGPQITVATTAVAPRPVPAPQEPSAPADTPDPTKAPALSELPVEEVDPLPVHAVPDAAPTPVPHVTLQDQQGRPLRSVAASAPPPPSYVPSVGPSSNPASSAPPPPSYKPSVGPASDYVAPSPPPASYRPSVGPPLGATAPSAPPPSSRPPVPDQSAAAAPVPQTAAVPEPALLSGPAHATGTVSLAVNGRNVQLYGVLPPARTDRCAIGTGTPQTCADVTQAMLAAKLAYTANVTCRRPPGARAADPARICVDASGTDIASYLVGEGLAMADRQASGGYAGAETTARSSGKGLWRFR